MPARRKYNWPELFAEYDQSGLSQTDFCKRHDINPKYFNLKLAKRRAKTSSAFTSFTVDTAALAKEDFILEVGHCKVHLPSTISMLALASLVKSLA